MMEFLATIILLYVAVGVFLVCATRSRGVIADLIFGMFWPVFLYIDWKNGLFKN